MKDNFIYDEGNCYGLLFTLIKKSKNNTFTLRKTQSSALFILLEIAATIGYNKKKSKFKVKKYIVPGCLPTYSISSGYITFDNGCKVIIKD